MQNKENKIRGVEGINSFKRKVYVGPCLAAGEPHHYSFKIYALDDLLQIPAGSQCSEPERAMSNHIIAYGEIMSIYQRKKIYYGNNTARRDVNYFRTKKRTSLYWSKDRNRSY
ncbi:MAG: hypothetical protein EPN37_18095 [Chitinophagaceae bacterium]|nr:MAG: hypothetical protein EPN37_18095 [Chitinophagaceae bacterium]